MHLLFDRLLLLHLTQLDLQLNEFLPFSILTFVDHELQALSSLPVLVRSLLQVLLDDPLLIKCHVHPLKLFLQGLDPLSVHLFHAVKLLILLIELDLEARLNLFLKFLDFLNVFHLKALLILSELLDHSIQRFGVLVLGPFDFAELLIA